MNVFKKRQKKVVNDATQAEIGNKVGKGSLFMKTIGMISTINTHHTMETSDNTQMTTLNSPEIPRSKGNKNVNSDSKGSDGKFSKVRGSDTKQTESKSSPVKVDSIARDKQAVSTSRSGASKGGGGEGKSKGSRCRPPKIERPTSIRLSAPVLANGAIDCPQVLDPNLLPKRKPHAEIDQNTLTKDVEDFRQPLSSANKLLQAQKTPSSSITNNNNLAINSNTKEIFWEIANFDLAKPLYESNTFSYADQCWNFIFGHNGSENYGFLMSLHQPQIQSIQFKCTFKLHHPFAFPLSKAREEPYVFGINSRTIRGFVNFASREEVNRHLQEGGILKLSAVLKLGTVGSASGPQIDHVSVIGGLKTMDDKESGGHALFTSSYIGDTQVTKITCDGEKTRDRLVPSSPTSPTESEGESWSPCFGFSFSIFRSTASFRNFFSSFFQRRYEKKEKDKKKKKEFDSRGRLREEGSVGLFGGKRNFKSSDSGNDSEGDDVQNVDSKYNKKRDSQRRGNDVNELRDTNNRTERARGPGDKGKYRDEQIVGENIRSPIRRDSSDYASNREMQNLMINRRDMLSGRDSDNDASPITKKNGRQDERGGKTGRPVKDVDSHERNKSFSPETSRGPEKKMFERHFRTNSSMI